MQPPDAPSDSRLPILCACRHQLEADDLDETIEGGEQAPSAAPASAASLVASTMVRTLSRTKRAAASYDNLPHTQLASF